MSVVKEIKSGINKGEGTAILYAGMLGLILSDLLPTPADAAYFFLERRLRDAWKKGEITAKQYWARETLYYYSLNPIYWILLMTIVVSIKGDLAQKAKVAFAIIGAGAVVGVIFTNLKKDIIQQGLEDKEKLELLEQYPEISEILNRPEFKNIAQQFKTGKTTLQKNIEELKQGK